MPSDAPAAADRLGTPILRASSPKPSPAIAETNEKVLTMVAADAALEPALDQVRRLVQADARLHGEDRHRVERQQPERRRAQRLAARERGLGKRGRWRSRGRCGMPALAADPAPGPRPPAAAP